MEKDLLSLKSNPIFQLSLASKELFHSNFLYWLSQDDNLRPYFEYVISSLCDNKIKWKETFGGDGPGKYNYVVLREFKNFDLCICKKKTAQTNNGSTAVGNGKGDNNNSTDEYQSKMVVDADGDECEDNNSSNEDKTEASDPNYDDIQQAGEIVFVLENKFKSIATAAQLRKYVGKTLEYNVPILKKRVVPNKSKYTESRDYDRLKDEIGKCKPKFVLLTLAKDFAEIDAIKEIDTFYCNKDGIIVETNNGFNNGNGSNKPFKSEGNKWIIRNYEEYAQFLINSLLDNNDEKLSTFNVSYQIIFNYISFIRTFSLEINKHLGDIKLTKNWNSIFEEKNKEYKSIRCSDIWQKMAMHKIAQELKTKISNDNYFSSFTIDMDSTDKHILDLKNPSKHIYIGVQYFHSLALLEIKYRINEKCMFCIQQQGKSLAAGIVIMSGRNKIITKTKKEKNDWQKEVEAFWESCKIEEICKIKEKCDKEANCPKMENRNIIKKFVPDKEIYAYESKDKTDGFYYKKIFFNDKNKPTIIVTLNYMVECLKNAIIIYPPQN